MYGRVTLNRLWTRPRSLVRAVEKRHDLVVKRGLLEAGGSMNSGRVLSSQPRVSSGERILSSGKARIVWRPCAQAHYFSTQAPDDAPLPNPVASFTDLGIRPTLASVLASEMGIKHPSGIQEQLIPPLLQGKADLLIRDVTGSGKSLGILLALLSVRRRNSRDTSPTAIILTPSRELAQQFLQWTRLLIPPSVIPDLEPIIQIAVRDALVVEGAESSLKRTVPHILVGTPGYLQELYGEGLFDTYHTRTIVVDEADTQVKLPKKHASIRQRFHRERHPSPTSILMDVWCRGNGRNDLSKPQVLLVSATMSGALRGHAKDRGWVGFKEEDGWDGEGKGQGSREKAVFLDGTDGAVRLAPRIQHHCLILDEGASVRNYRNREEREADEKREAAEAEKEGRSPPSSRRPFPGKPSKKDGLSKKEREEKERKMELERREFFVNNTTDAVAVVSHLSGILDPTKPPQDILIFVPAAYSMEEISGGLRAQGLHSEVLDQSALSGLLHRHAKSLDGKENGSGEEEKEGTERRKTTFWVGGEQTARGLDIPGCEWVFFLGAPKSIMSYVHVSGRTGRQGGSWHSGVGRCMTIVPAWQESKMRSLYGSMNLHVDPYEYVAN